jgi:tetratricopeptide (TPR) repeat protein
MGAQQSTKTEKTSKNSANKTVINYFRDSIISYQKWYGNDHLIDSLQSFYSNGKKNEVFYYDSSGQLHGTATQFNFDGEKMVSWTFEHGKLLIRNDFKLPLANTSQEEVSKAALEKLKLLNQKSNYKVTNFNDLYARAHLHKKLHNNTLSIKDYKQAEAYLDQYEYSDKKPTTETSKATIIKAKTVIYDALAELYSTFEMEENALHYYVKAIQTSPEDYRVLYNFTNYLVRDKSYKLAETYLIRIVTERPGHTHAQWGMASLYQKMEQYDKALHYANLALEKEAGLISRNSGNYDEGCNLKTIRGLAYHKLGETEKGIADLKEVLAKAKNNSYAMKNLGIIYLDQKKYNEACQLFQKAKELNYTKVFDEDDLEDLLKSACNGLAVKSSKTKTPFVYPNPIKDLISITEYPYKTFDYEFFDFQSISVLHGHSVDGTINTSKLVPGFYILKIFNNELPYTFKIIKE